MGQVLVRCFRDKLRYLSECRPPLEEIHLLFGEDRSAPHMKDFEDLIVCPSDSGAHILLAKSHQLVYKVRRVLSHNETTPKFHLYEVTFDGLIFDVPVGNIEKSRAELAAKPGAFHMLQAWHATASRLEMKIKKSGLWLVQTDHEKLVPAECWAMNMNVKYVARKDRNSSSESWCTQFALSDPSYKMFADPGGSITSTAMNVVRVFHKDELVCVARRQSFEQSMGNYYSRPFLGIQIKGSASTLCPRSMSSESGLGVPSHLLAPCGGGAALLPLLLVLVWGEDAVQVPKDYREIYVQRMRDSTGQTNHSKWDSDDAEMEQAFTTEMVNPPAPNMAISSHRSEVSSQLQGHGSMNTPSGW